MNDLPLLKQLAHAKLKNAFGSWLRRNGLADSAAEDLATRALNSKNFSISDDGVLSGDNPDIWLEELKRRATDAHLFQPSEPQRIEREKLEFFGYSRAEFEALTPEKRLALINQKLAKEQRAKEEARRRE
jgi:hypothetical protein